MSINRYYINRRTFGLGLAAAAAAQLVSPHVLRAQTRPEGAGSSLVFAGPGGAIGQILKGLFEGFTAETGIRVNYLEAPALDAYGRLLVERNRPSIDAFYTTSVIEDRGIQDNLWAPIDPGIVTNLPSLYDVARVPQDRGVRLGFTELGFMYNREAYEEANATPPAKWEDLWGEDSKGRIIIGDTTSTYTLLYVAWLNHVLGGTETDPTPAMKFLAEHKENLLAVVRTYPERMQMLGAKQAWITIDAANTSIPITKSNPALAWKTPEDGGPLTWTGISTIVNSPNPVGAQHFVNYLIRADVQKAYATNSWIAPANKEVVLEGELAEVVPYGLARLSGLTVLDYAELGRSVNTYRDLWNQYVAG